MNPPLWIRSFRIQRRARSTRHSERYPYLLPDPNATTPHESSGVARHFAYGLLWQMPLACPELRVAPVGSATDVTVQSGELPPAPAHALAAGPLRQVTPGEARFGLPGVTWRGCWYATATRSSSNASQRPTTRWCELRNTTPRQRRYDHARTSIEHPTTRRSAGRYADTPPHVGTTRPAAAPCQLGYGEPSR